MYYSREDGHSYLYKDQVRQALIQLLFKTNETEFDQKKFEFELSEMLKEKQFMCRSFEGKECFFSHVLDKEEAITAKKIKELHTASKLKNETAIDSWLKKYLVSENFKFSDEQLNAVKGIAAHKISILFYLRENLQNLFHHN